MVQTKYEYNKQWKENNPEKVRENSRRYYLKHKKHIQDRQKQWCRSNPDKMRIKYLKQTYQMTPEAFDDMVEDQNGVCLICELPCDKKKYLSVDHDHICCSGYKSCGKCIRGLLCDDCNNGLGRFKDERRLLHKADEYLEKYEISKSGGGNS